MTRFPFLLVSTLRSELKKRIKLRQRQEEKAVKVRRDMWSKTTECRAGLIHQLVIFARMLLNRPLSFALLPLRPSQKRSSPQTYVMTLSISEPSPNDPISIPFSNTTKFERERSRSCERSLRQSEHSLRHRPTLTNSMLPLRSRPLSRSTMPRSRRQERRRPIQLVSPEGSTTFVRRAPN